MDGSLITVKLNETALTRRLMLAACLLLFFVTLFRLWYAGTHQLLQDEAYYWLWSKHLDWGYFDNTPLAAIVIRFFTVLFGDTELGVRAGAVFCAVVVSLFVYLLANRLYGPRVAIFSMLLANFIPLFSAGSIIMTMDPVMLATWSATLYVISIAVGVGNEENCGEVIADSLLKKTRYDWWILAGLLCGLTAMSKLNGVLLLPSVLLFLAVSKKYRFWLTRPEPYIAAILAFLVFCPFIWWNHTHQNAFWTHIGVMGSRSDEHDPPLKWFFRFLGDQSVLLSPFFLFCFLYLLFADGKKSIKQQDNRLLFIWSPAVVVFCSTALLSLRSKVEGNWAVAAYITGAIMLTLLLVRLWESSTRRRAWAIVCLGFTLLLSTVAFFPQLLYWTCQAMHKPVPVKVDRTTELYGWNELAKRLQYEQDIMGTKPFIFSINYRMPSESAFYLPGHPKTYSLFLNDRANQYMFWENQKDLIGRDAIYIEDTDDLNHIDDLKAIFERAEPQPALQMMRPETYGKMPIRIIQVVRCYKFKGYDVKKWQKGW